MNQTLEWAKIVVSAVLSWPVVVLLTLFLFRRPLYMLFAATAEYRVSKLRFGSFTLELNELRREGQEAVDRINRLSVLHAETRILEWEIARKMAGSRLPADMDVEMEKKLVQMRELVQLDHESAVADAHAVPGRNRRQRAKSPENPT